MDSNRHEYVVGNDDSSLGRYFNNTVRGQFYQHNEAESSDKQQNFEYEFRIKESKSLHQDQICGGPTVGGNSFYQQDKPFLTRGIEGASYNPSPSISAEENMSHKSFTWEANYNCKQTQKRTQTHFYKVSSGTYYNESSYEPIVDTKINYASNVAFTPALCNASTSTVSEEVLRNIKVNHIEHVINPSNVIGTNQLQTSPNYGLKCPSIPSDDRSSTHLNLYMSTPEFSSEKFAKIVSHHNNKIPHEPTNQNNYVKLKSSNLHASVPNESAKSHRLQMSSISTTHALQDTYYTKDLDHNHLSQPVLSVRKPEQSNATYYLEGSGNVLPKISPVIMTQAHTNQPYVKSPVVLPGIHIISTNPSDHISYIKKEEDQHILLNESSIRGGPNASSIDSCCKDSVSFLAKKSNLISDLPQAYPNFESMSTNRLAINNTTSSNKIIECKGKSYYYEPLNYTYDVNSYNIRSKASTTIESASPVSKLHHNVYSEHVSHDQPFLKHQSEAHEISINNQNPLLDRHEQTHNKSVIITTDKLHSLSQPYSPVHQTTKKTILSKPNYKELINQVYAMRNATSEDELNLQIIKKTLNVDEQMLRAKLFTTNGVQSDNIHLLNRMPRNVTISNDVRDPGSFHTIGPPANFNRRMPSNTTYNLQNNMSSYKEGIKCNSYPLDLSMRTVKTNADSTDYKYNTYTSSLEQNRMYALPRVDFNPNFSLHTGNSEGKSFVDQRNRTATVVLNTNASSKKTEPLQHPAKEITNASSNLPNLSCEAKMQVVMTSPLPRLDNICKDIPCSSNAFEAKMPENLKESVSTDSFQLRPTVLETNPFASKNIVNTYDQIKLVHLPSVDNSTPFLSKSSLADVVAVASPSPIKNNCSSDFEQSPHILGRKRHIQDHVNFQRNEPTAKHSCCNDHPKKTENLLSSEVKVIAVNEVVAQLEVVRTAEKSIQTKMPTVHQNDPYLYSNIEINFNVKKENEISLSDITKSTERVKTEASAGISSRIRTKAELKGFTFSPPALEPYIPAEINIKTEPRPESSATENFLQDSPEEELQSDDFDWQKACNNFVEQLLANNKKKIKKDLHTTMGTFEQKIEDLHSCPVIVNSNCKDIQRSEKYSDDLLVDMSNTLLSADSTETIATFSKVEDKMMTKTTASYVQKKLNKRDRGTMRQHQEQRLAARFQGESSSETDHELDKQKLVRLKKPLKKIKTRHNKFSNNRFSECGSDNSSSSHCFKTKKLNFASACIPSSVTSKSKDMKFKQTLLQNKGEKIEEKHPNFSAISSNTFEKNSAEVSPKKPDSCIDKKSCKGQIKLKETENDTKIPSTSEKQLTFPAELNLTMTRSKKKMELELQLANSRVLRNDKVIRSSTSKQIKRKYVRKYGGHRNATNKESYIQESEDIMSTRLRSQTQKYIKNSEHKNTTKCNEAKIKSNKKNKQNPNDLYLEVYRYKRSLKVPPSLITIKHPCNSNNTLILPDIELYEDPKLYENKVSNNFKNHKNLGKLGNQMETHQEEPKSIIDLLHSRVTNNSNTCLKPQPTRFANNSFSQKELPPKIEDFNVTELTTNVGTEEEDAKEKKRHFSIFETKVFQTKTRTELKMLQKKEIIREIFVGDDRPASAPPDILQSIVGTEKMTYEQKYEQFLQQMNIVINEEKLRKFGRTITSVSSSLGEKPENVNNIEEIRDRIECESPKNKLSITSTELKRRRPGKYLRRKGSSGFDYIRKKKKSMASSTSGTTQLSQTLRKSEWDAKVDIKIKKEDDVCREVQKWVLNKGVGQSAMHKAARLGYIDVIVYCLDRLKMYPDPKDNAGYTPLHEACTNGWIDIARVLLQYGANHSEAAHSGIRPLHEATENDHEEIVRLLLSYGADPLVATYSGQTPVMLATTFEMRDILTNHLKEVQTVGSERKPWRFKGPWEIFDEGEHGYNILEGAPNFTCDMSRALKKSFLPSLPMNKKSFSQFGEASSKTVLDKCAVVLNNIDHFNSVCILNENNPEFLVENSDSEGEMFEFEEADILLPPLYLLKDEGTDKWVLLSDLCNLLKVKSKDTLLNKINLYSSSCSPHKNLMRELKMSDFLEKATCLQLLCSGEKVNICASKVVLIKYNESVRNLLGVKTILMKF